MIGRSTQGTGEARLRVSWWDSSTTYDASLNTPPPYIIHNANFPFPQPKPKEEKKDVFARVLERALKNREALFPLFLSPKRTLFRPVIRRDQDPTSLVYRRRKAHSYRCTNRGF